MLEKLKWTATAALIVGFGGVAAGVYEFIFIQLFGGILWLIASAWMRDKPLIVTNGVMTAAGVLGVLWNYFG